MLTIVLTSEGQNKRLCWSCLFSTWLLYFTLVSSCVSQSFISCLNSQEVSRRCWQKMQKSARNNPKGGGLHHHVISFSKHHLTCCYLTEKIQLTFSLFMDLIFKFKLVVSQRLIGLFEVFPFKYLYETSCFYLLEECSPRFCFLLLWSWSTFFSSSETKHRHWNVVRCFPILF